MSARSFVSLRPSASRDPYEARDSAASFTGYQAAGWLSSGHLQTIYAYYLRQTPNFTYRRECWETPDRDFIALDWLDASSEESRLLVMFHGLEGCSRSHYAVV
jgi:predicted alpha/beta-fold hydrolase